MRIRRGITIASCSAMLLVAAMLLAQAPSSAEMNLSGTTANVSGAPDAVRFEILRWSTADERDRLVAAWELKTVPGSGKAGAAKGAGKAGRGAAKAPEGGASNTVTPEGSLAKALQELTTVGYVWSSEMAGYAIRYAGKIANADGSQRIVLITQRRLGAVNQLWKPTEGTPNNLEFSIIELHLNAKGVGEGKASLTGKIAMDASAKIAVPDYAALPVIFRDVHPQVEKSAKGKQ